MNFKENASLIAGMVAELRLINIDVTCEVSKSFFNDKPRLTVYEWITSIRKTYKNDILVKTEPSRDIIKAFYLDADADFTECIAYLRALLPKEDFKGMDLNEIHYITENA